MAETRILERVVDTAVIALPVPVFGQLSLSEKMLAYHLSMAAIAGDSISYDQNYRHSLAIRDLFFDILKFKKAIDPQVYSKIELFAKRIAINHGIHESFSTKKFTPSFSYEEFLGAYESARRAGFAGELFEGFEQVLFDPSYDEMLTQKNPPPGKDVLTASAVNYYQSLSTKDLEGFTDTHPNNSTVVKSGGSITEQVWRAGARGIRGGLYSAQLKKVCKHLGEAAKFAGEQQRGHILKLKEYLERGDPGLMDEFNILWVRDNPAVDSIVGFIEEYKDPRGKKGFFEGIVFAKDEQEGKIIKSIADKAQELEDSAPWRQEYKKQWSRVPVSNAIAQILATGGGGPICWGGVNLPNSQALREQHGSKSVIMSNVTAASRAAFGGLVAGEFFDNEKDKEAYSKYMGIRGTILVTLHEIVGHGSGKKSASLKGEPREHLKEHYSTLEEARAELCSLFHIANPALSGIVPDDECWKSAYRGYILSDLIMLRALKNESEVHEDHMRAMHLISQYLIANGCAETYKREGKTYVRVNDYGKMRQGVSDLLSELMRIKAEGDYDAIATLVNKYARNFDPRLRDEIVARSERVKLPSYYAYVMPVPKLVKKDGVVVDVELKYPKNLLDQALTWRRLGA